jgi:hypothetical protein
MKNVSIANSRELPTMIHMVFTVTLDRDEDGFWVIVKNCGKLMRAGGPTARTHPSPVRSKACRWQAEAKGWVAGPQGK